MTRKHKILLIHHSPFIGGAGVSLLHILKAINSNNKDSQYDVTVYCPSNPNSMIKEIQKLGFNTVSNPSYIPIQEHFSGNVNFFFGYKSIKNKFNILFKKKNIKELIHSVNPQIIIVNSMTLSYIGQIGKDLGKETICFHRETYAKGLLGIRSKKIKKSLSNYFDKVVFISNFDMMQTSSRYLNNFKVITDKVEVEKYNKYYKKEEVIKGVAKIPENAFKILYTGGMNKFKGANVLISALAECDQDVHLIFLQYSGEKNKKTFKNFNTKKEKLKYLLGKDFSAQVLKIIDKKNMWDRIHFQPTTQDVEKYFLVTDIVVFPSLSPHQARPIYEAGAAKKPIIITKSKNISEFLTDGKNGLTFNNNDHMDLARKIMYLKKNPQIAKKLGESNYYNTMENHNFSDLKEEIKVLLQETLNSKSSGGEKIAYIE